MPYMLPRHSSEHQAEVYHNHTDCTEANNIEDRYFEWGTGNKRLCKDCERKANADAMVKKYGNGLFAMGSIPKMGLGAGLTNIFSFAKKPIRK